MRKVLYFILWPTVKSLALLCRLERTPINSIRGPLSELTAKAAASFFTLDTGWGGDDTAMEAICADSHLVDCVKETAREQIKSGHKSSNVEFLASFLEASSAK